MGDVRKDVPGNAQAEGQTTGSQAESFDFVVIGSGFGGGVSAMRLSEKGYHVLVLERGKRFRDEDFPRTNWNIWNYLWAPVMRCFGILQLSLFNGFFVFHSSGVGGGSLVYAGVLMEPDASFFDAESWKHLGDWRSILAPHYATARYMLGVARNPNLWPADEALHRVSQQLGFGDFAHHYPWVLYMWLMMALLVILGIIATKGISMIPTKGQKCV